MHPKYKLHDVIIFAKKYHPDNSIHNWNHIKHVVRNIKRISKNDDLIIAAYLHDIGYLQNNESNWSMSKYQELQDQHKQKSAELAKPFLKKLNYTNTQISFICEVIQHHGIGSAKKSKLNESKILCDADKMTQIGFGGFHIINKRMKFRKENFKIALQNAAKKNNDLYKSLFTNIAKKKINFEYKFMKFIYNLIL